MLLHPLRSQEFSFFFSPALSSPGTTKSFCLLPSPKLTPICHRYQWYAGKLLTTGSLGSGWGRGWWTGTHTCSILPPRCCKYSHHGQSLATNVTSPKSELEGDLTSRARTGRYHCSRRADGREPSASRSVKMTSLRVLYNRSLPDMVQWGQFRT